MGHRRPERALLFGPLDVGVDPLVVAGQVREGVDVPLVPPASRWDRSSGLAGPLGPGFPDLNRRCPAPYQRTGYGTSLRLDQHPSRGRGGSVFGPSRSAWPPVAAGAEATPAGSAAPPGDRQRAAPERHLKDPGRARRPRGWRWTRSGGQSARPADHTIRINEDQGRTRTRRARQRLVNSDGATCLTGPWSPAPMGSPTSPSPPRRSRSRRSRSGRRRRSQRPRPDRQHGPARSLGDPPLPGDRTSWAASGSYGQRGRQQ